MDTPDPSMKDESPAESSQTSIDHLPEDVLIHILSFLSTADAVKTSAVASTWQNLWCLVPSVNFDMYEFQRRNPGHSDYDGRLMFANFVSQALLRRPADCPLQKFKLLFYYRDYEVIKSYVDEWVRFVVASKGVELDLYFMDYGLGEDEENDPAILDPYEFDFSNILSSSIQVFKLHSCLLKFPEKDQCMKLGSIKELHLGYVHGGGDEFEKVIDSCDNLESLVLEYSGASSDLKIVAGNLKHLIFSGINPFSNDNTAVEICTPKLVSIEMVEFCCGMYNLANASSLVEAKIDFKVLSWWDFACWTNVISSLTRVERLSSYNLMVQAESNPKTIGDVKALIEQEVQGHPLQAPMTVAKLKFGANIFTEAFQFHLKYLTLKTGYVKVDILGLEVWFKKCPRLESLALVCHGYTQLADQLEEDEIADSPITFQIPHLREVRMEGYMGTKNEMFVVALLKKHGSVLKKITAFPAEVDQVKPPTFLL